jgi:hypothetical protein
MLFVAAGSNSFSQNIVAKWAGTYYAEAKNKDNLKTSFNLNIAAAAITLKYASDGEAAITYKNVKATAETPTKLKLIFDTTNGAMGTLCLEQEDKEYYFTGEPVYFINPGTGQLLATKRKL